MSSNSLPHASEHPWTAGDLTISAEALRVVDEDALRGYRAREEACGYLVGPRDAPLACDETVVMTNMANRLHQLDPEQYFRTAESFFAFNEKRFDNAVKAGAEAGRPVKVLYHSHLDVGAYFSPTDKAVMSMGTPPTNEAGDATLGSGPAWPLAFLVISVGKTGVDDRKLFVWKDGDFAEVAFCVADAAAHE